MVESVNVLATTFSSPVSTLTPKKTINCTLCFSRSMRLKTIMITPDFAKDKMNTIVSKCIENDCFGAFKVSGKSRYN